MIFQKNPLTVRGCIDRCWLFTFQTPVAEAQKLLPAPLEPVTHENFAFWNIVICYIREMRPKPLPAFVGINYWHVAYRLYVKFKQANGETVEGLYFIRSDCDRPIMSTLGNMLTDFNFHTARIAVDEKEDALECAVHSPEANAAIRIGHEPMSQLYPHSAFGSIPEAAAFLKYKPCGISVNKNSRVQLVRINRDESAWKSRVVKVHEAHWDFFDGKNVRPEICYEVEPVIYQWNRGVCVS